MAIDDVISIVRESLCLEEGVTIDENAPVSGLVDNVDMLDMADILFSAGAYNTDYLSDGEMTPEGRAFLTKAGVNYEGDSSALIFKQLTSRDINLMAQQMRQAA